MRNPTAMVSLLVLGLLITGRLGVADDKLPTETPPIDLQGYTNVHLQYYRWLDVRDGAYDHAAIFADTKSVWTNHVTPGLMPTGIAHIDREWRFQDVDLSTAITPGISSRPWRTSTQYQTR